MKMTVGMELAKAYQEELNRWSTLLEIAQEIVDDSKLDDNQRLKLANAIKAIKEHEPEVI